MTTLPSIAPSHLPNSFSGAHQRFGLRNSQVKGKFVSNAMTFSTAILLLLCAGLFLLPAPAQATAYVTCSGVTGVWSSPSTWALTTAPSVCGVGVPGAGDSAVIASGSTVTVKTNTVVGSNVSAVGSAITINGSSPSSFGTLIVSGGVSLTLRGYDRVNNLEMLIKQYGRFLPQPGAVILSDCATDGQCLIVNKGIIHSIGTATQPVTWSVPANRYSWNITGNTSYASSIRNSLDGTNLPNVSVARLNSPWIANSTGTGLGSAADSSVVLTSRTAGTMMVEVSSLSQVNQPGTYYINYDVGNIYWYQATGTTTFTATYKQLNFIGGSVQSTANTPYNEAVFNYANFTYMGSTAIAADWLLTFGNKQSSSVGTSRLAQAQFDTFRFCKRLIGITAPVTGTASDPILINGNTFYTAPPDTYGSGIFIMHTNTSNISFQNNYVQGRGTFLMVNTWASPATQTGWVVRKNVVSTPIFLYAAAAVWPGSVIDGNLLMAYAAAYDGRMIAGFNGSPSSPAAITNNVFIHPHRAINYESNLTIQGNFVADFDHHGLSGSINSDVLLSSIRISNNIITGSTGGSFSALELGYNHREWVDNIVVSENTVFNQKAGSALELGDAWDNAGPALISNLDADSNLFVSGVRGVMRSSDTATDSSRVHVLRGDWNAMYGDSANYKGINQLATFTYLGGEYNATNLRSVTGVSLFDPNYTAPQSGMSLTWTVASATNMSLSWNGGSPVQLASYSGSVTAASNNTAYGIPGFRSGLVSDSSKTFPTAQNNSSSPIGMWIKIVGGTGTGEVRRITNATATTLTIVPSWTTIPDTTSSYVIYTSEAKLYDSAGTGYVRAGIDWRSVPNSTTSDSGIGIVFHAPSANPNFVDSTRTWRSWDASLGGNGTEDSALARIVKNPVLITSSLLPYVRQGFRPTNLALKGSGYNGVDPGAVPLQ